MAPMLARMMRSARHPVGNRATESKKRSERAMALVARCGDCRIPGPDNPGLAMTAACDRHGCTATTRRGTRCRNSATYPEQRSCGIHAKALP